MTGRVISLVLGSGGARGLAHIGVLRCLEEQGFTVGYISGSSMGALIGGIYAARKLDVYEAWVKALRRRDIMRLLDWSFSGAVFKSDRIIDALRELIGDVAIEDLDIGFTAVATALNEGREVWLNRGSLWEAVRASIAAPLIFAPVERDGVLLVDGGLLNPVPIAPTFNSVADLTIAVDLDAPDEKLVAGESAGVERPPHAEEDAILGMRERITRFLDDLIPSRDSTEDTPPGALEIALRSMEAMQATISRMKLAAYAPRLVVPIPRNLATFFEFYRAEELIRFGYERTRETLARNL